MKDFSIGQSVTHSLTVSQEHLATQVGSGSVEVFATPALAALLEGAAAELAQALLDEPFTTVGTKLSLEHLAPSPLGAVVTATATLTAVEGRVFQFSLCASDNAGTIAQGTHERVSVKRDSFSQKALARIQPN